MLGVRSAQRGLLEADHLYLDYVGRDSFYGFLASMRGQLFRDEEFAELYCPDNGRDSVPPSLVATALLLQAYDKVSDAEAKQRADFDIRWKVALGIEVEDRLFAKSTLQLFRAQLILHDRVRAVFQRSLQLARQTGYLKGRRMKVAVDTTYILGRGAVKDTYNLLADGIVQVVRALSALDGTRPEEWALRHGLELYFGSSVKGEAEIDWDNQKERQALLPILFISGRVKRWEVEPKPAGASPNLSAALSVVCQPSVAAAGVLWPTFWPLGKDIPLLQCAGALPQRPFPLDSTPASRPVEIFAQSPAGP